MLEKTANKLYDKLKNKLGTIAIVSTITMTAGVFGMAYTGLSGIPKSNYYEGENLRIKKIKIEEQINKEYILKNLRHEQLVVRDSLVEILKNIKMDKKYLIAEKAYQKELSEYQNKVAIYGGVAILSALILGASGLLMIEYADRK